MGSETQRSTAELLSTMDAKIWAEEFMKTLAAAKPEIDESFMLGWFANAIMATHDIMARRFAVKLTDAELADAFKTLEYHAHCCEQGVDEKIEKIKRHCAAQRAALERIRMESLEALSVNIAKKAIGRGD